MWDLGDGGVSQMAYRMLLNAAGCQDALYALARRHPEPLARQPHKEGSM